MLDAGLHPISESAVSAATARRWLMERESPAWLLEPGQRDACSISSEPRSRPVLITGDGGQVVLSALWQGPEPAWLRPTMEVLAQLLALPADWDSYGARRIGQAAVTSVLALLREVMPDDAPAPQIVPTAAGGVQMEWHMRGIDLEVCVRPTGEGWVLFEDLETGEEWEGPAPDRLAAALNTLTQRA